MDKRSSRHCIARGVIVPSLCFHSVCWRKLMSTPPIYYQYCMQCLLRVFPECLADPCISADLEITVAMLVQIDKLVQLIESPVFTCLYLCLPGYHVLTFFNSKISACNCSNLSDTLTCSSACTASLCYCRKVVHSCLSVIASMQLTLLASFISHPNRRFPAS
jgi:hypothetical protein